MKKRLTLHINKWGKMILLTKTFSNDMNRVWTDKDRVNTNKSKMDKNNDNQFSPF